MKMRQSLARTATAVAVSAVSLIPSIASAQTGPSTGASTAFAGVVAARVERAPTTSSVVQVQTTRLDETWAQTLWTVMDGMRRTDRTERRAALRTLAAQPTSADTTNDDTPVLPAVTFGYGRPLLPPGALRDMLAQSPWELGPVYVEPGTETPVDTRGEHGWIPGAYLHLPWLIP